MAKAAKSEIQSPNGADLSVQLELVDPSVFAGSAIYSHALLAIYDWYVLGLSNLYAWRCATRHLLALYDECASLRHLDIGIGTGFYLDRCKFPGSSPRITLGDLNPNCIRKVTRRISRYMPASVLMNVFDPKTYPKGRFGSIGINYLLHCLPGPFSRKLEILSSLKPLLAEGGVIFGSTILGTEVKHNFFGRLLMRVYNRKGIFSNYEDNAAELEKALRTVFGNCEIELRGCVALFKARV